jgi:hypothetical protein
MYKYVTNMIKYSQIGAYSTLFDRQIFSRSRSFDDIIQISRQQARIARGALRYEEHLVVQRYLQGDRISCKDRWQEHKRLVD